MIVLHDFPGIGAEEVVVHLHTPISEARQALLSLCDRGMVSANAEHYELTDLGKLKADQIWNIAEAHAKDTFKQFSSEEVDTFTDVLRKLICQ